MKVWGQLKGAGTALALLAFGTLLGGCETAQKTAQQIIERDGETQTLISKLKPTYEPSKLAIGLERDVMKMRAETFGIIALPEMNDYLNGIRLRLLSKVGLTNLPGKIYLTANP
ncbi:MAG: hypothetical protein Q8R51_15340, partial [Azonexus sp.]|nr:hypothetical protein [Azonexus sp.]